jgi:hypothetical protein
MVTGECSCNENVQTAISRIRDGNSRATALSD